MARKMKDSGVEWIGEIPEEWEVRKLKNVSEINSGEYVSKEDYESQGIFDIIGSNGKIGTINKTNISKKVITTGRVGSIGTAHIVQNVWVTDNALIIESKNNILVNYLAYIIPMFPYDIISTGTAQPLITATTLKNQFIPYSNLQEQQKIAYFLDEKVGEIDFVIVKTKETIEDYKKYKQSIITDAVTKGLNPNVEMKESKIEWIGKIPIHWKIIRAKNVVMITNGTDSKTEGNIPVYGSGTQSFKTCGEYKEGPTVLIGRKGATLHIPHYIDGKYWNVDTAFDVKERDGKISLKYYYYTAICFDYKRYISQTTLPSMTQTDYGNMYIPYPSRSEQNLIIEYLDEKCAELDKLITKKEELLADLESYKKSLIYEYVTGKKEVML